MRGEGDRAVQLNKDCGINLNSLFPCNQLTATSYIYQSLGDVEWYVELKQSAWQQCERVRRGSPPAPLGGASALNAHWETRGPQKVGRWSHSVWLTPVAQFKLVVSNAGDDAVFVVVRQT